jgi:ABC-type transporter Mla subunit MlaD
MCSKLHKSISELAHAIRELGREIGQNNSNNAILHRLAEMETNIMATQAELAAQLTAATEQAAKIGGETRTLLTNIEDLLAQLATAGGVTPELQAAADALKAQLDVVDALVPDAPVV